MDLGYLRSRAWYLQAKILIPFDPERHHTLTPCSRDNERKTSL